ncbi:MAG: hypothetical protein RJQ07_08390 [Pseudomonadales bacterium]
MQDAELERILAAKLSPLSERTYADSIAPEVQSRIAAELVRRHRSRRMRPWLIALAVLLGGAISAPSLLANGWLTQLAALPGRFADASASIGTGLSQLDMGGALTSTLAGSWTTETSALIAMGVLLVLLFGWLIEADT